ncbi:hypothetical protein Trydic_g4101 [Trypoxylus dichotomus]
MALDFSAYVLNRVNIEDGAMYHGKHRFAGRVISRNIDVNWPPRSYDMTPLNFSLWGYVKSKVYPNKSASIDIRDIEAPMLGQTMDNFNSHIDIYQPRPGGYLNDIIFGA